ncbi:hypothetical protein GYB29_12750 [bacterium]|nr:hypothetical protein [Balneola sp.]MBR9918519.1 hypothetical protein [bacterium]
MSYYVALIDFDHLDHPVFLKSLAQSLSAHKTRKGILIHGDSEYTNRLMQTGMMREDARERAIMDLNHRLVSLFADHGVSTIGLQGFQKELIQKTESGLQLNKKVFDGLPYSPMLLISSLISDGEGRTYIPPTELAEFLVQELKDHELVLFSQDHDSDIFTQNSNAKEVKWSELSDEFKEKNLSEEQLQITNPAILTTGISFSGWPEPEKATKIR